MRKFLQNLGLINEIYFLFNKNRFWIATKMKYRLLYK